MIFVAWLIVDSAHDVAGLEEIVGVETSHGKAVDLVRAAWRTHSTNHGLNLPDLDDEVIAVVAGNVGDVWVNGHHWGPMAESRARL